MPTSNPLDVLLTHDRWAMRNLQDACTKLTSEQFHQRFEMGLGSLHDTLAHLASVTRAWGDLLAGREQRPPLFEKSQPQRTAAELSALLDEVLDEFAATARRHPVDELVTGSRGGRSYTFTRGGVITHVTTHNMHHRAQCLNMLRHVGVKPLPPSSVLEWMLMVDLQA
jgi:uncharacterized damage-inducible protein DinB